MCRLIMHFSILSSEVASRNAVMSRGEYFQSIFIGCHTHLCMLCHFIKDLIIDIIIGIVLTIEKIIYTYFKVFRNERKHLCIWL